MFLFQGTCLNNGGTHTGLHVIIILSGYWLILSLVWILCSFSKVLKFSKGHTGLQLTEMIKLGQLSKPPTKSIWYDLVVSIAVNCNNSLFYTEVLKSQVVFRFVEVMSKLTVRCKLVDVDVSWCQSHSICQVCTSCFKFTFVMVSLLKSQISHW